MIVEPSRKQREVLESGRVARMAKSVSLCCTHGVLSGNAIENINDSVIEEVIITDTIPPSEKAAASDRIKVLSIANLLGEAIKRITKGESISTLCY